MLDFLNKANSKSGLTLTEPAPDFIPYACHYSPDTLLTKNGELMSVIKISGFMQEQVGATQEDVRAVLRKAMQSFIPDTSYALWVHTIRRKKDISLSKEPQNAFGKNISDDWEKKYRWKNSYLNEIYLTIIKDSVPMKMAGVKDFARMISFKYLKKWHDQYLAKAHKELHHVVGNIQKAMESFGIQKLSLQEINGTYYSEPMQFLSKILSLADNQVPLLPQNLSEKLSAYKIAFGFNVLEVVSPAGKRFASIFTLKEYHELALNELDRFLQVPQEFIITQTFDFINSKRALNHYQKQAHVLQVSGDNNFYEVSGLKNILEESGNGPTSYGESQLTVMLLNAELQGLERDIESAYKALSSLGINATRRDLRMEECYWANLPANFAFATRRKPISSHRFAGMISLSTDAAGQKEGSPWGEALTLFRTAANTPYFFSFHQGKIGHTAIMGPKGTGKKKVLHFLMAQSMKFDTKIHYVGRSEQVELFTKAAGGSYHYIAPERSTAHPLKLPVTQENYVFLVRWLTMVMVTAGFSPQAKEKALIQQAAKYLLKMPPEQRSLSKLLPGFKKANAENLVNAIASWSQGGELEQWIVAENVMASTDAIQGYNIDGLLKDKRLLGPILSAILYKIESSLDGSPAVIAFDDAWSYFNNPLFMPTLAHMLDRFATKNAVVIFSTENVLNQKGKLIPADVAQRVVTKFFMPNKDAAKYSKSYQEIWQLNPAEFNELMSIQSNQKEFMVKTLTDSVVLRADFDSIKGLNLFHA